jgi:hypothetical protein
MNTSLSLPRTTTVGPVQPLTIEQARLSPAHADAEIDITLTIRKGDFDHLLSWMQRDAIDQARAARDADLNGRIDSLSVLLNHALRHAGTSGGRICATLLASMYNGDRVKFDVSDLRNGLDHNLFEHAMNAIRLCRETNKEPHQFFDNGGNLFEQMIRDWGLEKRRKAVKL